MDWLELLLYINNTKNYVGASRDTMNNSRSSLRNAIRNDYPELGMLDMDDLINQMYIMDYIDEGTKNKYLQLVKDFKDEPYTMFSVLDPSTAQEVANIYETIERHLPDLSNALTKSPDEIKKALSPGDSVLAQLGDVPAPDYLDTSFQSPFDLDVRDADPLKWWKGEELAEHHDLHWDLDEMYNKVKQGTAAAVARDEYNSAHQNWTGMKDTHENEVSYLSNLRNTKSDAITSGATAGARAANELLGMVDNTSQFSQNQANIANERFEAVNQALMNDANAEVTANNAYTNLGKNIFDNIEYLYMNDVDRRGGELASYANMFAADQALRAERIKANADMEAAQRRANSVIRQYGAGVNAQADKYKWMWDRFYDSAFEHGYQGRPQVVEANSNFFNWLMAEGLSQAGTTYDTYGNYRTLRDMQESNKK